MNMPWMQPQ
ncbi:hypothetical protein F383_30591 [Gossypium arboreum]|uniref:Uncharacterized protein n=1 Tax=Gossypium arboreum TaxID=29729 RepID=A0A0B0PNS4_GOSAR|nr:hypothetical protein F383_30591 [Gossypium arboreum]